MLICESMIEIDLISYWQHPHIGVYTFGVKAFMIAKAK